MGDDPESSSSGRTLVLCIGNVLMGDEGAGVAAAGMLAEALRDLGVAVLDGGTGGFHLLSHFDGVDRLILVDAASDGLPVGTVRALRPRFLNEFPRALSAHEIGLRDLLETATLLGTMPATDLVTISVATPFEVGAEMSPAVVAALPEVVSKVCELLAPAAAAVPAIAPAT